MQLEKSEITKVGSVINRFSCGNIDTLDKLGVHDKLLNFYETNYSANLMTLSLVGNHDLDTL
jgi:secreted Zn-dependent insulinase-like peptidase